MITQILNWLVKELNSLSDTNQSLVTLANVPSYVIEGEKRVAPNQVILSLAGFSGSLASGKKTTGFKMGESDSADGNSKLELKAVLLCDFDDLHYVQGIDRLEQIFRHLQKEEPWEATTGTEKIKLEIKNDSGTRADLSMMIRGASGKFLPAISYTLRVID